jgi:RNA polymerase sigma-70 factor (ECF subfamily)
VNNSDEVIEAVHSHVHEPLRTQLLRSVGGDRDLVDDILQDTWLQAVWTWRERGVPDRPAAWLATVARHLMLNRLRSRRRIGEESREALDRLPDTSLQSDVVGLVEQGERVAAVRAAMSRLSQVDRDLLSKFYDENISVASLAQSMDVTDRAVEGRLRRARSKLRAELVSAHGNDDALLRIPLLDATGVGIGTSTLTKRLAMTALLPFLLVLAVAPIAFVVGRLPRRQLARLRIVGGLLFLSIATISAPSAARTGYAQLAQLIGIAISVWGFWMLRTPETLTRR